MPIFHTVPINIEAFRFRTDKSPHWFSSAVGRGRVRLSELGCHVQTSIGMKWANNGDYIVEAPDGSLGCHDPETFSVFFRPGEFKEDINPHAIRAMIVTDGDDGRIDGVEDSPPETTRE